MKEPSVSAVGASAVPHSVVQVATAVPAFIGYTEKAKKGPKSVANVPTRLTSLAEYHEIYGGAPKPTFKIQPKEERADLSPLDRRGANLGPVLPQAPFNACLLYTSDAADD